jgi:integrase/recombinase XerD
VKHSWPRNNTYKTLESGFTSWLGTLGYAKTTVKGSPALVREFFFFLEQKHIFTMEKVTNQVIKAYFIYLSRRRHGKKPGALSTNTLRNNLGALRRFAKYLRETGQGNMEIPVTIPVDHQGIKTILTKQEIKQLYQVTDQTALGLRDKAMLSVYYGCGLRRNEGINLDVTDIQPDANKILVRKGKGYKERFVPMTLAVKADLENYMLHARITLTAGKANETAFFVNVKGSRLSGNMIYERLQQLKQKAGIIKDIGLHTLRHSIATHLLKDGMKIEMVSRFLGHSSLESTQIYTHLTNEET